MHIGKSKEMTLKKRVRKVKCLNAPEVHHEKVMTLQGKEKREKVHDEDKFTIQLNVFDVLSACNPYNKVIKHLIVNVEVFSKVLNTSQDFIRVKSKCTVQVSFQA